MSTSATLPAGYTIDPSDVQVDSQPTQASNIDPSDVQVTTLPPGYTIEQPDKASETRQMLVSGLTGMPTPNMNADDRASFQRGKAAGAVSVPAVAAATTGASLAAELGAGTLKAVAEMAKAHPTAAKFLGKVIGGAV